MSQAALVVREDGALTQSRVIEYTRMVEAAQEKLLQMPQVEIEIRHYFSYGVYAREMRMPKGSVMTGKIHKYQNLNILSQGELSVMTENGIERVKAPFTIVAPPGTKRIAYAHEDAVWTVIHGTHLTDLEKIEEEFTANDLGDYQMFVELMKGVESCPG